MKHHILVKWNDQVQNRAALIPAIEAIFADTLSIPGVHGVSVIPNVVNRPNRYDLMIVLTMDECALSAYDVSAAHHRWKDEYGALIAQKAIFDCD